ncbi:YbaB/EbfC family nucleoid-associated protein [Mycobacterium heidelbergense]|uniref:YbaB/EbfC family nucleoid-associated protein n=1 Tax=Mycobacterium heidelbergense TaxID=53376 RepID=UPI003CF5AA32
MTNDAFRHELAEILALVEEQAADLAELQKKRATLTAKAAVADGTVRVTVNAQGTVIDTAIDESYLDDFDFVDLGVHITAAAQSAVGQVARRSAELLAPLSERRRGLPSLPGIVEDIPDLSDSIPNLARFTDAGPTSDDSQGHWDEPVAYFTVESK